MRVFVSIWLGMLFVLGVFTGVGGLLNMGSSRVGNDKNDMEKIKVLSDANIYEIAHRVELEAVKKHLVVPPYFFSCTLGAIELTRPPYYGENLSDHDWGDGLWETPEFPEPTLQTPTLIKLTPKLVQVTDCANTVCNDHVIRIPPRMPATATRSGYCTVRFDVDTDGIPQNIVTPFCSGPLFSSPTIASIRKWKYTPRRVDGESVSFEVETFVRYILSDEDGNVIPEAH